jgi:pimeloyl-ACP methyl ester carboxylesterase
MLRKILLLIAVIVVILAAAVWYDYSRQIAAARARVEAESKLVNTPCGVIEYADTGPARANPATPAIFAIHGAGGGWDQSEDLARVLGAVGYRVVAPSRFGYLRTPLPGDASVEAQADAHACLMDALGLRQAVVVGGSMGAPSALQLCLRHPERCRALVLLFPMAWEPGSANGKPPTGIAKFVMETTLRSDFAFWAATKLARNTMMKTILATPVADFEKASPEEQARALAVLRDIEPISRREQGLRNDARVALSLPRYDLERIAAPTLVVAAEDDLYGTYARGRYTAEHIPGARFVGFKTGGHLLVGHRADAAKVVREFLSRFAAETPGSAPASPPGSEPTAAAPQAPQGK